MSEQTDALPLTPNFLATLMHTDWEIQGYMSEETMQLLRFSLRNGLQVDADPDLQLPYGLDPSDYPAGTPESDFVRYKRMQIASLLTGPLQNKTFLSEHIPMNVLRFYTSMTPQNQVLYKFICLVHQNKNSRWPWGVHDTVVIKWVAEMVQAYTSRQTRVDQVKLLLQEGAWHEAARKLWIRPEGNPLNPLRPVDVAKVLLNWMAPGPPPLDEGECVVLWETTYSAFCKKDDIGRRIQEEYPYVFEVVVDVVANMGKVYAPLTEYDTPSPFEGGETHLEMWSTLAKVVGTLVDEEMLMVNAQNRYMRK